MKLLIMGAPGAGKGTQATALAERYGVPAISTGDIFRYNIKNQTPLGVKVKAIIDAGDLVPDALTGEIVRDRLSQDDAAAGFLLDGYPRNLGQVGDLDAFLDERDEPLTGVIELSVPREESIRRIALRAAEQGRSDDNDESIAKRLSIYESETAPILDVYRERGVAFEVDGVGTLDEVFERIITALAARGIVA